MDGWRAGGWEGGVKGGRGKETESEKRDRDRVEREGGGLERERGRGGERERERERDLGGSAVSGARGAQGSNCKVGSTTTATIIS